jgi:hypothetical protein
MRPGSLFPEHQVEHPAASDVRPRASAVLQDDGASVILWAGPLAPQAAADRRRAGRAGRGRRSSSQLNKSSGFRLKNRSAAVVPSARLSQ